MSNEKGPFLPSGERTTFKLASRLLSPIARLLRTGQPAATIDRLFTSQHVGDLQLIVAAAFLVLVLVFVVGLGFAYESQRMAEWKKFAGPHSDWVYLHLLFDTLAGFLRVFVPVLAVFGAVLAWAYQVGSARLGVVDLFACEISTLCRIVTIADTARQYAEDFRRSSPAMADAAPQPPTNSFTSQENYFPVFEANNRDLQSLEARVVVNITAFYTFMKATRDSLRKLAETRSIRFEATVQASGLDAGHEALRNVIYMLYLGLESARHAVHDLVEFEPEKAEREIVILISELEAYRFLCEQYRNQNDIHQRRIILRASDYQRIVPRLQREVQIGFDAEAEIRCSSPRCSSRGASWEPAWQLLDELGLRFDAAMGAARACESGAPSLDADAQGQSASRIS